MCKKRNTQQFSRGADMKKNISISVAILLVAGVISAMPFVSGLLMEKTLRRVVDALNARHAATGSGYSVTIIDYERGYGTSDIIWKLNLGALKSVCSIEEIILKDHAEHGFTGVVSTTRLNSNPWYAYFVAENLLGRDPVHITTRYGLLGSVENTFALDTFMIPADNDTIDVKAGSIVTTTDRTLATFISVGNWGGLSGGDRLSIGPMSMDSNLTRISTFIWDGAVNFSLAGMHARLQKKHFQIESLAGSYTIDSSGDHKIVSTKTRFAVDGMRSDKINVKNASVQVAVNGMDAGGYTSLMRLCAANLFDTLSEKKAAPDRGGNVANTSMNKKMAASNLRALAACEDLLKKGLEIRISDLHIELDEGKIEGGVALRLLQDMSFMQFAPVINQPCILLDIFHLESALTFPAALAVGNPKLTRPLYPGMQTGLFVQKGDHLSHQAKTVDGKLMLNGNEVFLAR